MIVRQAQRHHEPRLDGVIVHHGCQFSRPSNQKDGNFRHIHDRRRIGTTDGAQIADGKRSTSEITDSEIVVPNTRGKVRERISDIRNRHPICIFQRGNHQPPIGVDRDAEIDVILVDDLLVFGINYRVQGRMVLEGGRDRFDQERHRREFDPARCVIVFAGLAKRL